jgi:hypothetical protein
MDQLVKVLIFQSPFEAFALVNYFVACLSRPGCPGAYKTLDNLTANCRIITDVA